MASSSSTAVLLLLLCTSTAISAQTCNSPNTFKTPKTPPFTNCASLPHLSASLHYTFNSSSSTLSMAFSAPPPAPSGWIAWAINPDSPSMAGSQALLAFNSPNGSVSVSTYALRSYSQIIKAPLSYPVSGLAAEARDDTLTVFATWQLPPNTDKINQVWQVGPSVSGGRPDKHDFAPANLNAKGILDLASAKSPAIAPAPDSGNNAAGVGQQRSCRC